MWSEYFSGKQSVIKDTYQRVAFHVAPSCDANARTLAHQLFRIYSMCNQRFHLVFDLDLDNKREDDAIALFLAFKTSFEALLSSTDKVQDGLCLTLTTTSMPSKPSLYELFENNKAKSGDETRQRFGIDTLIIGHQSTRESTVECISSLHQQYGTKISIGLIHSTEDQDLFKLQWLIEHCPKGSIRTVSVGSLEDIPNLHLRVVDFIQAKGFDALCIVPKRYLSRSYTTAHAMHFSFAHLVAFLQMFATGLWRPCLHRVDVIQIQQEQTDDLP